MEKKNLSGNKALQISHAYTVHSIYATVPYMKYAIVYFIYQLPLQH
jgi:hypothetical protein